MHLTQVHNAHDIQFQLDLPSNLGSFEPIFQVFGSSIWLVDIIVEGGDLTKRFLRLVDGSIVHSNQLSAICEVLKESRASLAFWVRDYHWSLILIFACMAEKKSQKAHLPIYRAISPSLFIHPVPILSSPTFLFLDSCFLVYQDSNITDPDQDCQTLILSKPPGEIPSGEFLEDFKHIIQISPDLVVSFDFIQLCQIRV